MGNKQSSSQVAWALLMEGVTNARLNTHRMRHLLNRALKLIDVSDEKEHLYQVAGDLILGMPQRMDLLERDLDRTSLALSKMGDDFLSSRMSISDKNLINEAIASAFGYSNQRDSERLAKRYLRSKMVQNEEKL